MLKKLLVTTDLSERALPALELALLLGKALSASVDVLHVVDIGALSTMPLPSRADPAILGHQIEAQLTQARAALDAADTPVSDDPARIAVHTRVGIPWEEIDRASTAHGAEMIVMSTHGRTGLPHLLLGSVTERVMRGAPIPTLTVRSSGDPEGDPDARAPTPRLPRRILVATDLSEGSLPALELADRLAEQLHATLTLVHVVDIAYAAVALLNTREENDQLQQSLILKAGDAARAFLERHRQALSPRVREASLLLRLGEAPREIEVCARDIRAELVVIGRHGHRGFKRWLMGSVAEQVVRLAPCPVLTVPPRHGSESQPSAREN